MGLSERCCWSRTYNTTCNCNSLFESGLGGGGGLAEQEDVYRAACNWCNYVFWAERAQIIKRGPASRGRYLFFYCVWMNNLLCC